MKPTKNYVLVADAGEENTKTTPGGIILQTAVDVKSSKPGFVLAVGPDVYGVKQEDKVALEWSKAMPVMLNGEKVVLIAEDFIYAVY